MKLDSVAQILEDAGVGTIKRNIFINFMPGDVKEGILLRDGFSGTKINHYLPGFHKTDFQLIVRAVKFQDGEALIEAAILALTINTRAIYGNMDIHNMRPRSLPFSYPLSPGNITEFVTQIDVAYNIV
jgi:hypothetical protein